MELEAQLAALGELGITLDPGITIDDLLYSMRRERYEQKPFQLLLVVLGGEVEREPWGRPFCARAWNFDTECIEGDGAYVEIARQLSRVAGRPGAFSDLRDHVDLEAGEAWVEYTVDGKQRRWEIEVDDDWADTTVIAHMMGDLEQDGAKFRAKDNGQAMVLYYLTDAAALRLSELAGETLTTVTNP